MNDMKANYKTISAAVLICAFGFFNVGLPIVVYLCPMMQAAPAECRTFCESSSESVALVNQNASCCNSYIVAERNTTPFVKTDKHNPSLAVVVTSQYVELSNIDVTIIGNLPAELYASKSPPIYLLNSAFLI